MIDGTAGILSRRRLLLRRDGEAPADLPEIRHRREVRTQRTLRCRSCAHVITSPSEGLPVEGRDVHRRTNPAGIEFEFGCFRSAPGVSLDGEPTALYSWFPGYRWRYAHCGLCNLHLGWFFDGPEPTFYALILSRLEGGSEPDLGGERGDSG